MLPPRRSNDYQWMSEPPRNEIHIVPGIKQNLLSTNKFVDAGYAWLFDEDEVAVYDMTDTKITTSRGAVLKGWRVPNEGLWRIPLVPNVKLGSIEKDTVLSRKSSQEILQDKPPTLPEQLLNVHEL